MPLNGVCVLFEGRKGLKEGLLGNLGRWAHKFEGDGWDKRQEACLEDGSAMCVDGGREMEEEMTLSFT